ncbi:hypothetical protein AY599_21095 [Leptolyngbya valderiana BDU 20041]|nr:hypothetical protein AY599_21095 [Leptolyngbya valderiana BDU 20041]
MRAWCVAALWLVGAAAQSPGQAQDLANERASMVARVDAAVASAARPGATAQERIAALDLAIAERAALMRALPEDAHAPIWMLDQAADELARLTLSLADARLVVGLMGQWRRDESLRAAESAYELARRAGERIEARFERQRAILDAGGELAPGDRTLNRRLAETEQAVRRPLLMGRAMALRVAGGGRDADAAEAANLLEGLRVGSGDAAAIRDASLAIAEVHLPGRKQRALERLDALRAGEPAPPGSPTHAEAALLRARLERGVDAQARAIAEAAGTLPFVDRQGMVDPALLVLATEARARVLVEGGRLESGARALMGLEERAELGGTRAQRAGLADDRLAAIAQAYDGWSAVAPEVVLRAARALVAQDRPDLDERAIPLLVGLIERDQTGDGADDGAGAAMAERVPAMELLARLWLATAQDASEDDATLARRTAALGLVRALLDEPEANLDGLLPTAATLSLGRAGMTLEPADRRALLDAALRHAPGHASADRWRLGLAANLMAADRDWRRALDLAQSAMASDDARTRADAVALAGAAHTLLVGRAGDDAASLETLEAALEFARAHPEATEIDPAALGLRLASALIDRGRREDAVGVISAVKDVPGLDALILRARASDVLDLPEQAFAAYLEASGSLRPDDPKGRYWLVWTRLLELLNDERQVRARAGSQRSAEQIEARLRGYLLKLRGIDDDLGGEPWGRRLRAVEASLDR